MRMTLNNIMKLVGGIALMTTLNGCAYADEGNTQVTDQPASSDTGASRTAEEAAVEAQFEPLFEFLAAEKKDFSNVSTFISRISIIDKTIINEVKTETGSVIAENNNVIEENRLLLKKSDTESQVFSGYFNERLNEQGLKYNEEGVKYDVRLVENEIVFENTTSEKFISDLYFPIVATTDIKKGIVTSFSKDHPETELTTLSYDLNPGIPIVQKLLSSYDNQEEVRSVVLNLSKSGNSEFRAIFTVYLSDKSISLSVNLK
ncbi:TPA: hypothetical protein U0K67_001226 [Streptococcus suis]|nr:hypothetical protein [Streptococcus suis]